MSSRRIRRRGCSPGSPIPIFLSSAASGRAATKRLASEISVDGVRNGLQVFQLSAAFGGWRIAIVDAAEDLNRNSANALLKMIEEPPQRSLILIVSHRPGQVLPTIRSRCRRLRLDPLSEDEIVRAAIGLGPPWSSRRPEARRRRGQARRRIGSRGAHPPCAGIGRRRRADRLDRRRPAATRSPSGRETCRCGRRAGRRRDLSGLPSRTLRLARRLMRATSSPARSGWKRLAGFGTASATRERETEALNLDRKLHILALFAEIAATAPAR